MGSSTVGSAAISLDQLTAKVAEVYVRCGFDADKSIGTLQVCLLARYSCVYVCASFLSVCFPLLPDWF